jgi:chaperonin GroES
MEKIQIKPLGENVLLKLVSEETKTQSGLYLPDTASKEESDEGIVKAIGESKKIQVKVGEKVIFSTYGGKKIKKDKDEYLLIKNEDILAIIE